MDKYSICGSCECKISNNLYNVELSRMHPAILTVYSTELRSLEYIHHQLIYIKR